MEDVSPQLFIDTVMGYQKTAAIKAAVALDLFTAIAKEDGDVDRIAKRVQAAERGVSKLCDYLTVQGFLHKDAQRYRLTPSTANPSAAEMEVLPWQVPNGSCSLSARDG